MAGFCVADELWLEGEPTVAQWAYVGPGFLAIFGPKLLTHCSSSFWMFLY